MITNSHHPARIRTRLYSMNAAFMSFQRREGGIHALKSTAGGLPHVTAACRHLQLSDDPAAQAANLDYPYGQLSTARLDAMNAIRISRTGCKYRIAVTARTVSDRRS